MSCKRIQCHSHWESPMSPTGVVKFYSEKRGYGFIEWEGEDAFFHISEIEDEEDVFAVGEEVEFETEDGDKGPVAIGVRRKVDGWSRSSTDRTEDS